MIIFLASSFITTVSADYPRKRGSQGMSYGSTNDRIIMYGGQTEFTYVNYKTNTWVYDYNTDTWSLKDIPRHLKILTSY